MAPERAIVAIDLAEQVQEVVVCDHDNVVLARRTKKSTRAWELGSTLAWARRPGRAAGFDDVVLACEPAGHRWWVIAELCDEAGVEVVCVQPLMVHCERERGDLIRDRSDARDAVLIPSWWPSCGAMSRNGRPRRGPGCVASAPAVTTT